MSNTPLALTMGDPAGIGIEIAAKAWIARQDQNIPPFILIGDGTLVQQKLNSLFDNLSVQMITAVDQGLDIFDTHIPVLDPGIGQSDAELTLAAIECAVSLCQQGTVAAMITNPIQKKRLYDAGFKHPGHTEFLAELTGAAGKSVMMLACSDLKVVPATIHIPINEISSHLTSVHLERVIRTTLSDLKQRFGKRNPHVVIAGLNPHAGEEGSIGREEVEIITPLVQKLTTEGHHVTGPYPADSLFHAAARQKYDAAICMYHDQALIPIKTIDFERGVNVTLGLPIIRTSPDHGTADNIAGKGIANPASLIAALQMADEMVRLSKDKLHG